MSRYFSLYQYEITRIEERIDFAKDMIVFSPRHMPVVAYISISILPGFRYKFPLFQKIHIHRKTISDFILGIIQRQSVNEA